VPGNDGGYSPGVNGPVESITPVDGATAHPTGLPPEPRTGGGYPWYGGSMSIIWFLVIGTVAGYLAGKFTRGRSFGLLGNLLLGIVGAIIGGFLFGLLGLSVHGTVGSLVMATVGAVVLLWIAARFT
jgi:uncharacterized membrane protein YeaQ/YmgE (transglycosylase-associated protein family)